MIKEATSKLIEKENLTYDEAIAVMDEIMSGSTSQVQTAAFLAALSTKGETIEEITASAAGMLVSLIFRGRGGFKAAAAPWAFAFAGPSFLMWLPHAVFSGFLLLGMSQQEFMSYTADPGFWQTAFLIYQGLAALLLAVGSVRAAAAGRSLRPAGALLTGLFAAAVFGGIIGLVIR